MNVRSPLVSRPRISFMEVIYDVTCIRKVITVTVVPLVIAIPIGLLITVLELATVAAGVYYVIELPLLSIVQYYRLR